MDPRRNPYAPGAGTPPPELAGRADMIENAAIALDRIRGGRAARSFVFHGLRGVGKTVLLNRIRLDAEARGLATAPMEAPEGRSLPGVLVPNLRAALIRLSRGEAMKAGLARAARARAGFASARRVKDGEMEVGLEVEPEKGLADSGDLEIDLAALLSAVAAAARDGETACVLFIDELQYVPSPQLAALLAALHRLAQAQEPVTMMAAGLPQILARLGSARSYAERLFEFVKVDPLSPDAAREALVKPALQEGVAWTEEALARVVEATEGYPYFVQEWGKHCWAIAEDSPIGAETVTHATAAALAELDAGF